MRSRILLTVLLTALFVIASGCGNVKNCPVCGTTTADGYADIVNITVPEHNPTGEPGGPFNSFDISWINQRPTWISSRTALVWPWSSWTPINNIAVNAIQGSNAVTNAGNAGQSMRPKHTAYCGRGWKFHPLRMPERPLSPDLGFWRERQVRRVPRAPSAALRVPTA